ncbi:MAG: DUF6748 domain-containing protein [Polyangiaceae bacterium]
MNSLKAVFALALLAPLSACAPEAPVESNPEESSEVDARAVGVDTVYVVVGQDFKKCAWPMCGGVYVKAVNQTKTTCADGSKAAQCYVADLDLVALGLNEQEASDTRNAAVAGRVLLSGGFGPIPGFASTKLVVQKAFEQRTDAVPTGTFYTVGPSGIVCITTPCPSLAAHKMNAGTTTNVTDVDFSALGLTSDEVAAAFETIQAKNLVLSGTIKTTGNKKKLKVSQIFDTVEPATQALCLTDAACGANMHCDTSVCLSNCAPGMVCPAVCYGACAPGAPAPTGGTCVDACGDQSADETCWCDPACTYYGDCCADYASTCK